MRLEKRAQCSPFVHLDGTFSFIFLLTLVILKKKKKAASNTFYKAENLKAPHCEKVNQPARGNGFQETPDLFQVGKSVWEMRKKTVNSA